MTMKKPNIVFVLADDLGYGDFGRFNGGLSSTPVLDGLIDESVCMTQQYTASPVCNPSRACILTGRYPHRTGSIDTLEWRGLERLALRETTLADVLKRNGYRTGLVGKWHLGAFDKRYHPNSRGFDEAVCFRGGMHDYYDWRLEFNEQVVKSDGTYLTDLFTEQACQFIERNKDSSFFLHLTYNAPHTPLQAPQDEVEPFLEKGLFNRGVSTLYGMIHRMDTGVGRVLETINRCGIEDNTIFIFTSDNGPQFGGEGDEKLDRFNCHFNGCKGNVYEGGIRVPLMIRWPDGFQRGQQIDSMVHFCDLFPTLLAAAGVDCPCELDIDGQNILPLLRGESLDTVTKRFWQWNRYTPVVSFNAAMRDGPWKLVRPSVPEVIEVPDIHWLEVSMYNPEYFIENGIVTDPEPQIELPPQPKPELYNIEQDPLEKYNAADEHPEIVHRMEIELENWFESVEADRRSIND